MTPIEPRPGRPAARRARVPDRPPPRLLLNLTAYDALASGARERALGLASALLRLGAEVSVAEARGADLAALVALPAPGAPLRVHRTSLDPGRPVVRALRSGAVLRALLAEERPDAFLTDFYPAPRVRGVRTVVTVHDLRYLSPSVGRRPVRAAWFHAAYGRTLRAADLVVTPSEFTRREVVERLGADPARVAVVPNAVPEALRRRPGPEAAAARERLDLPRRPYLLALGVLERRKNLHRLLEALALLHARGEEAPPLVIAGRGGPEERRLRATAANLLPESAVHWAGYVRPADLPAVYAGARALVHPATYEGFGMPVVEAMAQGVPVACADAAALPEAAGGAAVLFDPTDAGAIAHAVGLAVSDDRLRRRLVALGEDRVRALTFDASAARLLDAAGLRA